MALPPEVRANYITTIDSILAAENIEEVSEKRIRRGIQDSVQYDITPQKAAIKELILERFDVFAQKAGVLEEPVASVETPAPAPATNGHHTPVRGVANGDSKSASPTTKREVDSDAMSDLVDDAPPKKKRKASAEDDAALAARLQAEENKLSRPTRGAAPRRAAPAKRKKTPKKKSAAKIKDNSDEDDSDDSGTKPVRNTGFHKPLNLSPALSELLDGETSLSRPQTTKRLWQYIKGHDLQDPSDKRHIFCDEKMKAVFKCDRVHMFTMTKLLNQQMYNPEE